MCYLHRSAAHRGGRVSGRRSVVGPMGERSAQRQRLLSTRCRSMCKRTQRVVRTQRCTPIQLTVMGSSSVERPTGRQLVASADGRRRVFTWGTPPAREGCRSARQGVSGADTHHLVAQATPPQVSDGECTSRGGGVPETAKFRKIVGAMTICQLTEHDRLSYVVERS